jgi:hypothetical protein
VGDESLEKAELPVVQLLCRLGQALGFDVATEVEASQSAWVDVVWFDKRVSAGDIGRRNNKPKMRFDPVLPVYGFEVEIKTGLNAKHIKGSVSNLDILGAQVGVIIIGTGNIQQAKKTSRELAEMSDAEVSRKLMDRVYRWVYAEAQPRSRIVVMSERQVRDWAISKKVTK